VRSFPAALVLAAIALAAAAQAPPVFEVGLDLVYVTATVRDEEGQVVRDLQAEDFVLWEDGRVQNLRLFATAGGPEEREELELNLGMLFDTSQSMIDHLRLSRASAVHFLESIPRARDLILIFFDRDIRISRYNSENQQGIFQRILETQGQGDTALYDSIAVYVSRAIDSPGRKVLVIFTDGEDTTSRTPASEVIDLVRSTNVTIYPVAFPTERRRGGAELRARFFLGELAKSSGGEVFRPAAWKELAEIYGKILDELEGQYVLGFVSDNPKRDGKFRRLKVDVAPPDLHVRHRSGYNAPEEPPD
jgi:Ca-activated chloride channel family protein